MQRFHYKAGRKKEYRIIKQEGYDLRDWSKRKIAIRSSGSHGPVDLILIDLTERIIRFIQAKPESMSENAREALRQENNNLNGSFFCKFEVI